MREAPPAASVIETAAGVGRRGSRVPSPSTVLLALIIGQTSMHACMAGVRMAAPLQVLRQSHAAWSVGVLMGLFAAAPVVLALHAGRLADRHGYHRPMLAAVWLAVAGGACAWLSTLLPTVGFWLVCLSAVLTGAAANLGLITVQRTAGRSARDAVDLRRIFSWLGLAPALSNVVGPVLAGTLIDAGGFALSFAALGLLPLLTLVSMRFVPRETPLRRPAGMPAPRAWDLLRTPGLRRLLLVNWLLSASWDVHSFVVPILGNERHFSASAIGLVLGVFAGAVALVRLAIPLVARRWSEAQVLVGAMLGTAAVFMVYPFVQTAWLMAACAVLLGLALGAVQPMIMTTLHQLTPRERHGEAIALRSMAINSSSALMPLVFGIVGTALGAASLFWVMGAAVALGSLQARRIGR
jgi:MFS family permease